MGSRNTSLALSVLMLLGSLAVPSLILEGQSQSTLYTVDNGNLSQIDLLVIYPEPEPGSTHIDDLNSDYGETTVDGYLDKLFSQVNDIYARGEIGARFNLLPSMQVNMSHLDEDWKARLCTAMMNPHNSPYQDYIEEINSIRNSTYADVIIYWRQSGDGGPGASGASTIPAEEDEAYIHITHWAMNPRTTSHEIGHLLGGQHHVATQSIINVSVEGGEFQEYDVRTVMSSNPPYMGYPTIRLWTFSDANATVNGTFPCGYGLEPGNCTFAEESPIGNASRSNADIMRVRTPMMADFRSQPKPFDEFDAAVSNLHEQWQINGSQVAIAYNGSIVFQGSYGLADEESSTPVNSSSRFRIASLSKAITSAAIFTLNKSHAITLDDRMVDLIPHLLPDPIAGCSFPNHSNDYSIDNITVYDLLHHRGGWDRGTSGDPTYKHWNYWEGTSNPCIDSNELVTDFDAGNLAPIPMERVIEEWLRTPLDFEPGGQREYSNIGYQILGQIIENVSSMSYEAYVQQYVLAPMGITGMQIGRTLPEERAEDEVTYYDYEGDTSPCTFPSGQNSDGDPIFPYAPDPYCGDFVVEEKDSGGGWIATASDYARFISFISGTIESKEFNDSFDYFVSSPDTWTWSDHYGSGIYFDPNDLGEWTHSGSFSGTSTWFKRDSTDSGGTAIVVMFSNTKPSSSSWGSQRSSTLTNSMLSVDYSNVSPIEDPPEEEPIWSWPDPLPPQSQDIMGNAHLAIQGTLRASSDINASWNVYVSIRDDYGIDLLPDMNLGVRYQIDQHLGNGDGWLSIPEIADFVTLVEVARNLTDSELLGCCMIDDSSMQAQNGTIVTVIPPANGSVDSNGSWGWSENSQLQGMTDSRSTRILDIPRVGGLIEEIPLRVTLPENWEFRYSAMLEIIDGSPGNFTIHRQDAPVASDIRISLGRNSAPNVFAERETGISTIPLEIPTRYSGQCTDSVLDTTTQWWTLHRNGTLMNMTHSNVLEFIALDFNFTHGEVASIVMHCMDSFSTSSTWYDNVVIDGIKPTWNAVFQVNIDGIVNDLDSNQTNIEIPSGSHFYFFFDASDENGLPVNIEVTSNKSQGWMHWGEGTLEFADHFYQSEHINGMHLNVTERHKAKEPSEYSLNLSVTDDASNIVKHEWTIVISDGTGPTIIPDIISNGSSVSPDSPARMGEDIVLSLTESFDDLDAITDVIWEVRVDDQVIAEEALWSEVENLLLPLYEPGIYLIHILAWDSSDNKEEISFGLTVSPSLGVYPSVLDHHAVGELVEGESVKIIVTMQNTGADIGSGTLCSGDICSFDFVISAADSTGPSIFNVELILDLNSTGPIDLRFEWSSDSAESEGVLEIDNDYVVVSQWQMPIQVLLGVLSVLMLLAWFAHRTWGPESQRP